MARRRFREAHPSPWTTFVEGAAELDRRTGGEATVLFSSTVFLFQFLPAALAVYFGTTWAFRRQTWPNLALIALSLTFYFIGSGQLVLLLLASILVNYGLGRGVERLDDGRCKLLLAGGIVYNLAILFWFKYFNFALASLDAVVNALGWARPAAQPLSIALPVGISFYTFMAISYLVDAYRTRRAAPSLPHFALYLSLFPHLVAGPIVRYSEIRDEIASRRITSDLFVEGMYRFSIGLLRKVVIADSLAVVADRIFALPAGDLTTATAWIGALCYAFQIFYDFAGYTDMAIGLARMFGFHFPENFDQPYTAASVTEFWRRWHMSLTRWFRDYLYIPLGGNRSGAARTYLNLVAVFFLCGLWHGASWTFVVWGLYHGTLLVIERIADRRFGVRSRGPAGVAITFFLVTIGWVFFRSPTIGGAFAYLAAMAGHGAPTPVHPLLVGDVLTRSTVFYVVVAAIFAFIPPRAAARITSHPRLAATQGAFAILALFAGIAYVSETTFKPFVYFRF